MEFIRNQIVTNGCIGGCCENFTLPYYFEDLKVMFTAREKGMDHFIDKLGNERKVYSDPGLEMMIDMLIPLGHCGDYNPNLKPEDEGKTIGELLAKENIVTQEDWDKRTNEIKHWYILIDGKWTMRVFTCKHFDTEKRVCNNYENRPAMCRQFGEQCHYKGCTHTSTLAALEEQINKLKDEGVDLPS